jgi:hypothetical protein
MFLEFGGDQAWLEKGTEVLPEKLKKLTELNTILAYYPHELINNIKGIKQYSLKSVRSDKIFFFLFTSVK